MYRSSVDAMMDVINGTTEKTAEVDQKGKMYVQKSRPDDLVHNLRDISIRKSVLKNGIGQCAVQLRCKNGIEYSIQAYGKEAEDLYNEAEKQLLLLQREI